MSEGKKRYIEYAIAFAISIAGGYFVLYVQLNDLFSWPSYVYSMITIFFAVVFLALVLFATRSFLTNYRLSKQARSIIIPFDVDIEKVNSYFRSLEKYRELMWEVKVSGERTELYAIDGPFCPKEKCYTELKGRQTFFGRYQYECPTCSFKRKSDYSVVTLKSDFEKVTKARLNREAEEKVQKAMDLRRQQFEKDVKELNGQIKEHIRDKEEDGV